jgi:hypothetical protein
MIPRSPSQRLHDHFALELDVQATIEGSTRQPPRDSGGRQLLFVLIQCESPLLK